MVFNPKTYREVFQSLGRWKNKELSKKIYKFYLQLTNKLINKYKVFSNLNLLSHNYTIIIMYRKYKKEQNGKFFFIVQTLTLAILEWCYRCNQRRVFGHQ